MTIILRSFKKKTHIGINQNDFTYVKTDAYGRSLIAGHHRGRPRLLSNQSVGNDETSDAKVHDGGAEGGAFVKFVWKDGGEIDG